MLGQIIEKIAQKICLFTDIICVTDSVILGNFLVNKENKGDFKINMNMDHLSITLNSQKLSPEYIKLLKNVSTDNICLKTKKIRTKKRIAYLGKDEDLITLAVHCFILMSHEIDYFLVSNENGQLLN